MLFINCSKMARIRIHTRERTKEKPYKINSYFFAKLVVRQKRSQGWAKYVFLCKICAEGLFLSFPWRLKNVKNGSKIGLALFSNGRHFRMSIPKMKTNIFFRRKLSKLLEKDTILHVHNYIFPETRVNKSKQWTHYWRGVRGIFFRGAKLFFQIFPGVKCFCPVDFFFFG